MIPFDPAPCPLSEARTFVTQILFQEGRPLSESPRRGSCLILENELSKETHMLTKQETLLRKVCPGGEQQGNGTQENCSATWLAVLGFMVMRLLSGLSLANHSDSVPSWWLRHCSARMDSSEKDSGRLVGHMDWYLLSFDLSDFFLLVVAYLVRLPYRTSCCKTAHATDHHLVWPGVSGFLFPLTTWPCRLGEMPYRSGKKFPSFFLDLSSSLVLDSALKLNWYRTDE